MSPIRDFDQERIAKRTGQDRTFKIGGETMEFKPAVHPEALFDAATVTADDDPKKILLVADALMEAYLVPDSAPRWKRVRENRDDPISLGEILELMQWIVEEQTGRPTGAPSLSQNGEGATGTESTGSSSSPVAVA